MNKEVRCPVCGRLLGKFSGMGEIKCPKCKRIITFDTKERQ